MKKRKCKGSTGINHGEPAGNEQGEVHESAKEDPVSKRDRKKKRKSTVGVREPVEKIEHERDEATSNELALELKRKKKQKKRKASAGFCAIDI